MRTLAIVPISIVAGVAVWFSWPHRDLSRDLSITLVNDVNADGQIPVTDTHPVTISFRVENRGRAPLGPLHVSGICDCQVESELPRTMEPGTRADLAFRIFPVPAGLTFGEIMISDEAGASRTVPFSIINTAPIPRFEASSPVLVRIVRGDHVSQDSQFSVIEEAGRDPFITSARVVGCPALETLSATIVETRDRALSGSNDYVRRVYTVRVEGNDIQNVTGIATDIELYSSADEEAFHSISLTGVLQDSLVVVPAIVSLPDIGETRRVQILNRGKTDIQAEQLSVTVERVDGNITITPNADFVADGGPVIAEFLVERNDENATGDVEVFFQASLYVTARLRITSSAVVSTSSE